MATSCIYEQYGTLSLQMRVYLPRRAVVKGGSIEAVGRGVVRQDQAHQRNRGEKV